MDKPRVVKDFEKLDEAIQEQIKLNYPYGFDRHLITFKNIKGEFVSALPFEAEDKYYLIRMTKAEAREIIDEDDDYNEDGHLKEGVKEEYEEKYLDIEESYDDENEEMASIEDDYDDDWIPMRCL